MRILLVNDDGYRSKGINILKKVLESFGHICVIAAPKEQQSAMSMAITTTRELKVEEPEEDVFVIDGTPADCVLAVFRALREQLEPENFDLLISGINEGGNLSTDILYSGTCSAAKQGSLLGIKSIAISACTSKNEEEIFEGAALFLAENLEHFYSRLNSDAFININYPKHYNKKGYKIATLSKLVYHSLSVTEVKRQVVANTKETNREIDIDVVNDNYVSVSAVKVLPSVDLDLENKLLK